MRQDLAAWQEEVAPFWLGEGPPPASEWDWRNTVPREVQEAWAQPLYEEATSFEKIPVLEAAASVGWMPRIGLDELIDETALYYRVRDDARDAEAVPLAVDARI